MSVKALAAKYKVTVMSADNDGLPDLLFYSVCSSYSANLPGCA